MNFLEVSLVGLDAFRQGYQSGDIRQKFSDAHHSTFDTDNKISIACLDFLSWGLTHLLPLHRVISLRLKCLEGGFRCVEIVRGLYLLYFTNVEGLNRKTYQLQIVTNLLNIARLALQIFQPMHAMTATVVVCALDALLKTTFACQRFGVDQTMRVVLGGTNSFLLMAAGVTIIKTAHAVQHSLISAASITLLVPLIMIVKAVASRVLIYHSPPGIIIHKLMAWTFAILIATPLSMIAMVKSGWSKSVGDNALGSIAFLNGTLAALIGGMTAAKSIVLGRIQTWEELNKSAKLTMAAISLSRLD